ncbi:hypothetical protein DM01DRAFT_1118191 [Hesseltinella vesiculosa]|uniref:Uncharacterized protein n=1 Tax=Hesseltinella vesiculosa TaxID=101127 RepID=A0A1X2G9T1_9FUNG|nr:hypothetical protein DM01DRAFT_1118191 [Hesseltinella vesiculosa]
MMTVNTCTLPLNPEKFFAAHSSAGPARSGSRCFHHGKMIQLYPAPQPGEIFCCPQFGWPSEKWEVIIFLLQMVCFLFWFGKLTLFIFLATVQSIQNWTIVI